MLLIEMQRSQTDSRAMVGFALQKMYRGISSKKQIWKLCFVTHNVFLDFAFTHNPLMKSSLKAVGGGVWEGVEKSQTLWNFAKKIKKKKEPKTNNNNKKTGMSFLVMLFGIYFYLLTIQALHRLRCIVGI